MQWALGRVSDDPAVIDVLLDNMRNDPVPLFRDKAACALAYDQVHLSPAQKLRLFEGLIGALDDPKLQVRQVAIQALRSSHTRQGLPPRRRRAGTKRGGRRVAALAGRVPGEPVRPAWRSHGGLSLLQPARAPGPATRAAARPAVLASYSFDDDVATGPDTFAIWQGARHNKGGRGHVRLSSAFHVSGHRSVELQDVAGDGDFPELQGYFPVRRTGRLFFHFAFLTTDPGRS